LLIQRHGEVDLVHSSLDPVEECRWEGGGSPFVVAGEFALLTLDDRGIKRAVIVNGTLLRSGDFALRPAPPPAGKVVAVDFQSNAIVIDRALVNPGVWTGAVAVLGNALHSTSLTISDAEAAADSTTLRFGDTLFIVGMGAVAETDDEAHTVVSDRALSGYGRVDGGRHQGRWLYNETRTKGYRIKAIQGKRLQLEAVEGRLSEIFSDADGDGRSLYWISDVGPGDTYRLPTSASYARGTDG
jgi:hypothetical protein